MNAAQKRRTRVRLVVLLAVPLLGLVSGADDAAAQSLGFEAGLAGVENYSPVTPSLGASLFLPLTDRFKGVVSYSRWTGCDHGSCQEPRVGYGNQGVNLIGLFRVLGSYRGSNASVGAGTGWYEKRRLAGIESETYWENALTLSSELRVPVSFNSSAYLRGDLSFPSTDNQPRWGFLRVGVDVGTF